MPHPSIFLLGLKSCGGLFLEAEFDVVTGDFGELEELEQLFGSPILFQ